MPSTHKVPVTVAYGDGIGPEIMEATLAILEAAGAEIAPEVIEVGEKVYKSGVAGGIHDSAWATLRSTRVFLKAPITTPQGGGYKSLNVTTRTALGLYANVRPNLAFAPFVRTQHPGLDVVIIRENEEDLYTGIEYRQTNSMYETLKLVSRPGCEKIIRYAFAYARAYNRKKVTCFSKDNIMKMTDGLFHKVFDEIGAEYPDIEKDHWIIDIGSALLADQPERFDVIVTLNLYGDIISDIAAQVAGSVGMGGSANIGEQCAMFEAIHGSAPDIAGKGIANPSGLLNAAIMMLVHIGQGETAARVHNAWLKTIEDGIHTGDIYKEGLSRERVGTRAFSEAVVARLGMLPEHFKAVSYAGAPEPIKGEERIVRKESKVLAGVDVYLDWEGNATALGDSVNGLAAGNFVLSAITNRGAKVYPGAFPETFVTDHWRCRFLSATGGTNGKEVVDLQARLLQAGYDVVKTENLYTFNGVPGYSAIQGEV
ncbi:NADP-dependent isocitrate dehydrogenase [Ravibacter arvi]|uniref:Isocitrate dehydrogenase [NADP] n=1 Tax=Ravibacter arvi TaxID=2051041 RepID=A0ABP8LQZ9_9BACT